MKFLDDIMNYEDIEQFLDFLAYCLWREYRFNNWILLNGKGFNGKSVLFNLIEAFFGKHNVSGESLDRIVTERFAMANLFQKMVNVDADISKEFITKEESGRLKKLTGNDESPGEYKYRTAFKFRNFAKLMFACNEVPQTEDKTDAFFRRLILINLKQQFLGDLVDSHLLEKMITEEELTGLLYVLIQRLPRVLKYGVRPTTNEVMQETYETYISSVDPTEFFIEKTIQPSSDLSVRVPKLQLFRSYIIFFNKKGLTPDSEQAFSRKVKSKGYDYKQFRIEDGSKPYFWIGLILLNWEALEEKERQVADFAENNPRPNYIDSERKEMK